MKRLMIFALIALIPLHSSYAFYGWIMPPYGKEYQPGEATEVFMMYEDGVETVILKPEWQGNMKEFGMVYPVPAKPTVKAGPVNLFWELDEATNPWVQPPVVYEEARYDEESVKATADAVTVVEEAQVAEYKVTILKATSATSLTSWLKKNGYNYTKEDTSKVKYYVDKGDFYFVALKVDASHFTDPIVQPMYLEDEAVSDGEDAKMAIAPDYWWWGELSPVEITFATDEPQLPMRTLKSQKNDMKFDLYTLGSKAIYIPGVDTVWSNLVDSEFMRQVPSLAGYDAKAKWLVRQEVKFVPANSNEDLFLTLAETEDFTTVTAGTQVRFNPKLLDKDTGIVPGERGQVVSTDGKGNAYAFGRNLTIGSVGEDVRALQQLLNAEGFIVAKSGPGSVGNESTYFGPATKAALIKYQNYYRSDIGITTGTGYFGPMTIKFVNR
ncbi:MAG: hypothetical protein RLZZ480_415 [Candidatus Parcubacteria bacterium]|jgi:hypothetical protein